MKVILDIKENNRIPFFMEMVKSLDYISVIKEVKLDSTITQELKEEGEAREVVRQIQDARKSAGCQLDQLIKVKLPDWPEKYTDYILKETLATALVKGSQVEIVE